MKGWKGESANMSYEMDSVEVRSIQFAYDPVEYLRGFYADKQDAGHDEQNAVFKVIDEFEALIFAVAYDRMQTENASLNEYLTAEEAFIQKKAFIKLLKDVGLKEEHLLVWASISTEGISSEEYLEEQ